MMADDTSTALLFKCVSNDKLDEVRTLIENGKAIVKAKDNRGRTPLFYAMAKSSRSLVDYLLSENASIHSKDNCKLSILAFFIENCCVSQENNLSSTFFSERINILLERRIKRKHVFETMMSLIFCKYILVLMHKVDFKTISSILETAKAYTTEENERSLVENILEKVRQSGNDRRSCETVLPEILDLLFELEADPNSADSDGNTALHYATCLPFYGISEETIMKLLNKLDGLGVMFGLENHKKETPILFCLSKGLSETTSKTDPLSEIKILVKVCKFLLEHGSSMRERAQSGNSVFHIIMNIFQQFLKWYDNSRGQEIFKEGITLLQVFSSLDVAKGIVNLGNANCNTPLHFWASLVPSQFLDHRTFQEFLKSTLQNLKKCGAHLENRNENGETPLHLCRTWAAVTLLLDAEANPNVVDSSGRPPLLTAAKSNQPVKNLESLYPDMTPEKFWKIVIKKGLDPWAVDIQGESVLSILLETESSNLATGLVQAACDQDSPVRFDPLVMISLLKATCKDKSPNGTWKKDLAERILKSTKCPVNGNNNEDSPLHYCCRNIIEAASMCVSIDEIKTTVHWSMAELLHSFGADPRTPDATGLTCLDISEKCPALTDLLMEPIDLDRFPVLIKKWKSVSKTHERHLAKVARGLKSEQVESYWYHQDHLQKGAFGAVFAGINEKDGREVAIKRIEKIRMSRPKDEREITSLAALTDCEQVVRYFCFFEDKFFSYIVLELMDGNLEDLLNKAMTVKEREKICQDVVKGLSYVHFQNFLHRDLKPTNILYKNSPKLCLKIADFGLSHCIDSTGSSSGYSINAGTRCWIAPEVFMSTEKAQHSKSSDVFACGLVLHYILSVKKHPFAPNESARKSTFKIIHETESNVKNGEMKGWDDSLCPEATDLVKAMLNSDEKRRPSAVKVLEHPFFWTRKKKLNLLIAVGNQPEFGCPRAKRTLPLTAVENDLEAHLTTIVKHGKWNDPGYVHMPAIYAEMTKKRKYDTHSVVELVRFIRNAYARVTELSQPDLLLKDFVFLEYFPNLLMEVYKAVTTHGWDQMREEIKYAIHK